VPEPLVRRRGAGVDATLSLSSAQTARRVDERADLLIGHHVGRSGQPTA